MRGSVAGPLAWPHAWAWWLESIQLHVRRDAAMMYCCWGQDKGIMQRALGAWGVDDALI